MRANVRESCFKGQEAGPDGDLNPHHQMEVFLGGSWHLEALPAVCRAAVQQLRPGHVVLAGNADLPVTVDHELGATVLQGWVEVRMTQLLPGVD